MSVRPSDPPPFALSLSNGLPCHPAREGEGFDKLSPNGFFLPQLLACLKALP
jgi:hypothetical protein